MPAEVRRKLKEQDFLLTSAARIVFFMKILVMPPPGNEYGCRLRNTWPTLEQGMISSRPCNTSKNKIKTGKKKISLAFKHDIAKCGS
jgi:hypothetical protein